jgi:hypothetical protein
MLTQSVVKVILFNLWELFMKLTQLFGFIAIVLFSVSACATENQRQTEPVHLNSAS